MLVVGGLIGFSLFPKADTPNFLIAVQTPDGSSLAETDRALRFVEEEARGDAGGGVVFLQSRPRQPARSTTTRSAPRARATTATCSSSCKSYDTAETPRLLDGLRQRAQAIPERAHLRAGVPERPADHGADRHPRRRRISTRCTRSPAQVEKIIKETPGTRDVDNPVRMRAHESAARRGLAEGGAARRADGGVRSRRATRGRRDSRRALQGFRRRAVRHHRAHADRCAPRPACARPGARRHAQRRDAAAQSARARRVQLRADRDRPLQPRARRHDQRRGAERLQH